MADSEVRQKVEAWAKVRAEEVMDYFGLVPQMAPFDGRDKALSPECIAGLEQIIARTERPDKDYAIEHAEYLAKAAEAFLRVSNERAKAAEESEDVEDLMNADELLSDHRRALNSAIYEFRKRALRALPAAPEEKK